MEHPEVNVLEAKLVVKVASVATVVEVVVRVNVEGALSAPGDEVVRVEAPDVGAHLVDPLRHQLDGAIFAAWEVAGVVGAAAGLVGELPGHDGGRVLVAGDHLLDVRLEVVLDDRELVELRAISTS